MGVRSDKRDPDRVDLVECVPDPRGNLLGHRAPRQENGDEGIPPLDIGRTLGRAFPRL